MDVGQAIAVLDAGAREFALFACIGFLFGGLDDLAIDLVFLSRRRWRAWPPPAIHRARIAVFVPSWDEAAVIGAMLTRALGRFDHPDFRLYAGVYPNDRATLAVIAGVAARDLRLRLVINERPGPTTKGDNLNSMWRALLREEAADGWRADAIVLHDSEDVVHPAELDVFERFLPDFAVVQLPVIPLIAPESRWVSAHYADEFAEVQPRNLLVRETLGAGLPLAGVGCALRRDAMDALAAARGGQPFDAASLVEDYELGLTIAAAGGRSCFARVRDAAGVPVCVRAYFPTGVAAAARQKARWMAGIALLGWDRLGWGGRFSLGEYWMRMRDRRALLAVLMLAIAYVTLAIGALAALAHVLLGTAPPSPTGWLPTLLIINSALLLWRMGMRSCATGQIYGWREGLRAVPRTLVSNFVAMLAARRALAIYLETLSGAPARWDKTAHRFPTAPGE